MAVLPHMPRLFPEKEANSIAGLFQCRLWRGYGSASDGMERTATDYRQIVFPIYVYNSPKGGYVIISGENKAYPILAYSKGRKFDKDKISDDEKEVLKTYAREIELIRYDPRIPAKAMEAWRNIPEYISADSRFSI